MRYLLTSRQWAIIAITDNCAVRIFLRWKTVCEQEAGRHKGENADPSNLEAGPLLTCDEFETSEYHVRREEGN